MYQVDDSAVLDEQANDLQVALSGGEHERGHPDGIDGVHVGAEFDQQTDHVDVALVINHIKLV